MCVDQSVQKMMVMRLSLQEPATRKKTRQKGVVNKVLLKTRDLEFLVCS